MRLLTRIAVFCILIGIMIGFFLRSRVKQPGLLLAVSFLPWLIHSLYITVSVLEIPAIHLILFLSGNAIVLACTLVLGRPYLRRRSLWLALLPVAQGVIYSLSLLWFIRIIAIDGLGLNSLSWVTYAGTVLAMSGVLLGYLFGLPKIKLGSVLRRR
jgi:hypothetical protein